MARSTRTGCARDPRTSADRPFNDRGLDDNPTGADDVMASPTASASAASGAAGDYVTTMSVRDALPSTGGPSLVSAATLVLLVGSGLVTRRLVRRGRSILASKRVGRRS